jgi:hypothetical protein
MTRLPKDPEWINGPVDYRHANPRLPAPTLTLLVKALDALTQDDDRHGAIEYLKQALSAEPHEPQGLDVETLARALMRERFRAAYTMAYGDPADTARILLAEYVRLRDEATR